jgi:hypothetical protein
MLEGALVEDAAVLAAVDHALTTGEPINITDTQLISVVQTWVARFIANNI